MNKSDLIDAVAKRAGTSKVTANCMIDTLLREITTQLKKGGSVTFVGFGTFKMAISSRRRPTTTACGR